MRTRHPCAGVKPESAGLEPWGTLPTTDPEQLPMECSKAKVLRASTLAFEEGENHMEGC